MSKEEDNQFIDEMTEEEVEDAVSKRKSKEERKSCCDKFMSCLCCHSCGNTCCMRGTKSRRCAKKFFKMMAVGQINNGLYFGRSQQYLSVLSGIFTLVGAIVLVALAIQTFIDVFNRKNVTAKIEY